MEGAGSYNYPFARLIPGELPERTELNALLLWPEPSDEPTEWLGQCGTPVFQFGN